MNDNAVSNINQILTSFDKFVDVIENPVWVKFATAEDIKTALKLSYFLEKVITNFKSKNSLTEFMTVLQKWWKRENKTKVYSEDFLQFASDQLLKKIFMTENMTETTLDIAIRVYTSIYSKHRLQRVLKDMILTSRSYKALTDFANLNMTDKDKREVEYNLHLKNWSHLLETAGSAGEHILKKEISDYLSLYKVESTLHILIGILSISDANANEKSVQNVIMENILLKLLDRSVLSKSFWLTLFTKLDLNYVCRACSNFKALLESLFGFVVYIGGMMRKEDNIWISDLNTSLCPEIGYQVLLMFIKNIYLINPGSKDYVINKLNEAKQYTESFIWDELKHDLG